MSGHFKQPCGIPRLQKLASNYGLQYDHQHARDVDYCTMIFLLLLFKSLAGLDIKEISLGPSVILPRLVDPLTLLKQRPRQL
jgi:hypothetical protein